MTVTVSVTISSTTTTKTTTPLLVYDDVIIDRAGEVTMGTGVMKGVVMAVEELALVEEAKGGGAAVGVLANEVLLVNVGMTTLPSKAEPHSLLA